MDILQVKNITKKFDDRVIIDNVSFNIPRGRIVGLLGKNGSGKTTILKMINDLLTPDCGTITIDGMTPPSPKTKAVISYLPERTYFDPSQTVRGVFELFEDFYADFRPQLAFQMLEHLGIKPDQRLKTLSKGNKEKVCLILVMSRNAKLYVLDEPIAGVDPAARDYVISTIINNYNPDATVLISTHLIADVEQVLDDVLFLQNGHLLLHRSVDSIREEEGLSVDGLFREVFKW